MSVPELQARIEELTNQLSRSKANLRKVAHKNKKSKKKLQRKKGFDTAKTKVKSSRPQKKATKLKGGQAKERPWKPPPIFAEASHESFAFQQSEATALKKKIFEHLKTHIEIRHTANTTTIDQIIEQEKSKSVDVSSVFLVNIGWVVDKYLQWVHLMPRVMPFYAVKSNPDVNILRTLKMLGAGFDCASEAEIAAVKKLGALSENVIFANPCKGKSHIAYAKQSQVPTMTFDNPHEVDKIMSIYPQAKLVLRILPDDKYSLMPFGKKFGASWEESKLLIHKCKEVKAQLIGVSFHVGSGCFGTVAYKNALQLAKEVFDYAKEQGVILTLLDIGGGFPGTDDGQLRFDEIASTVTAALDELFPKSMGVRIIGEPGRYFCSGSSTLAVVVNSKRKKKLVAPTLDATPLAADLEDLGRDSTNELDYHEDEDDFHDGDEEVGGNFGLHASASAPELLDLELNRQGLPEGRGDDDSYSQSDDETVFRNPQAVVSSESEFLYYLSDGVYGSFNNIVFDHAQPHPVLLNVGPKTIAEQQKSLLLYKSRLFGPTCDSIDVICDCVELPELDIGDWLLFPQMGAYTIAAASSFNGFSPPQSSYIMSWNEDGDADSVPSPLNTSSTAASGPLPVASAAAPSAASPGGGPMTTAVSSSSLPHIKK